MAERYGFVYIWFDIKRKMFYIGSHWGTIDDGYVCSSRRMRRAHKRRPQTFRRRILSKVHTDRKDLLAEEQKWLEFIPTNQLGIRYYNLKKAATAKFWTPEQKAALKKTLTGRRFTDEHKRHISEGKKGQGRGIQKTDDHRSKISSSLKGRKLTPEHILKMATTMSEVMKGEANHFYGKTHSPESIARIKENRSHQVISEETREKMRQSHLKRWEAKRQSCS